jgi:sodium/potassium-transporting ATPase subunit alpha
MSSSDKDADKKTERRQSERRPSLLVPVQASQRSQSERRVSKMGDLKKEIEMDDHKISLEEICFRYGVDIDTGLPTAKAEQLLLKNGLNLLTPPKKVPKWKKFLKNMTNGFAILLWCGSFFAMLAFVIKYTSDPTTPLDNVWLSVLLAFVVFATGCFQFYRENKSDQIMESFAKMLPQQATVYRDGSKHNIPAEQLVVGDIVHIEIGARVPADIRIIKNGGLKVDNSSLTGEAEPLSRSTECTHNNPLETKNLAFFGTFAVEGSATGLVVRTGDNTAMGRIAKLATGLEQQKTHLAEELEHFIHLVTVLAFIFGFSFFFISLGLGYQVVDSFVFLIGLVIANVPEGLMACLTVCLALSAKSMAKKNCLVKHLEAIEGLGSIGIICSDKTGTLTMNRMTVSHMWMDNRIVKINMNDAKETSHTFDNEAFEDDDYGPEQKLTSKKARPTDTQFEFKNSQTWRSLMKCAMLCNRAEFKQDPENVSKEPMKRACTGDASETAILQYSEHILGDIMKFRRDHKKVVEIPFNSTNKYQLSVHEDPDLNDGSRLLVMKGAPERVIERCTRIMINGEDIELDDDWKVSFNKSYEALGGMGERVLGFCDTILNPQEYPSDHVFDLENPDIFPPKNLRFLGFISLIDPPKPNVPEAIAKCHSAGIKVFMVTGDHPITAKAIAKAVGIIKEETREDIARRMKISPDQVNPKDAKAIVIPGSQLAQMNSSDLNSALRNHKEIVFARTSPQQKLLIVEGCQKLGVLVGVTGDGVNDSPAMKQADIGISMGITGSDVSKQVADMVLLDDNFATIVTGVEEGRLIFDNIAKIIQYTFTKNMAELIPFLIYIILAIPLGLGTITILCVDLGTDILPALSLTYEKPERGLMTRKPRDPVKDRMTNTKLVSVCYGQIGIAQASGGFFTYFVCFAQNGFLPSRLLGIREYWDSPSINDLQDSFGGEWTYSQRVMLQKTAQTCFYIAIVVCQWANVMLCKTKQDSLFQHGFRNHYTNLSIIGTLAIACFLIYVPNLNEGLGLLPLKFLWWLTPIPFFAFVFMHGEVYKYLKRRFPGGFLEKEFSF